MILGLTVAELVMRGIKITMLSAINFVAWFLIPSFISTTLPGGLPVSTVTVAGFAVTIILLSAAGGLFSGTFVEYLARASAALVSVVYLVVITNFGDLRMLVKLESQAVDVSLSFTPLVYILMVPPLLSILINAWGLIAYSGEKRNIEEATVALE